MDRFTEQAVLTHRKNFRMQTSVATASNGTRSMTRAPHNPASLPSLDWEDVRFFTALARLGSFPAAARALGVSTGLVRKRLAHLEAALDMALFVRDGDRLALNSAGAAVLAEAAQMEMAACSLVQLRARRLSFRERDDCTAAANPRRR